MAIAELLIAKGANVNAKRTMDGLTPLHFAASRNQKAMVELLIFKAADVNAKGSGGTPLHWAAAFGDTKLVELLLEKGTDAYAIDGRGQTPFDWAKRENRKETKEGR